MKRIYLSPPYVLGSEQSLVEDAFATNWIAPSDRMWTRPPLETRQHRVRHHPDYAS